MLHVGHQNLKKRKIDKNLIKIGDQKTASSDVYNLVTCLCVFYHFNIFLIKERIMSLKYMNSKPDIVCSSNS